MYNYNEVVIYYIYESDDAGDFRNTIRYFVSNKNCYEDNHIMWLIPLDEYNPDSKVCGFIRVDKKSIKKATIEQILIHKLSQ